jgi:glutamyl-tRNA reductase
MVDIAVPRDIEEEVSTLDDVYLYTVDDLQAVIEDNMKSRQNAAEQAEMMVNQEVGAYMEWLQARKQMGLIKAYRDDADNMRQETLAKALRRLKNGKSAEDTLTFLAHTLTNKLSHNATAAMNKAAHNGDLELLASACQILNLKQKQS